VADDARHAVIGGGLSAALLLAVMVFIISRFGMRIPLQRFFMISAYLMIALAFVFVGKGIAALQEAGSLAHTLVAFPRIDLLGIYPNLEGLTAQALVLIVAALLVWRQRRAG
jgi:high-affinity iron transporter